jgi:putative ABC transport system permease protein
VNVLLTLRVALRALRKNKMRAALTVLGVVIGIAAVTTMVSIGQSATALVQGELQSLGTNVIIVFPSSMFHGGVHQALGTVATLTAADCEAVGSECQSVAAVSPVVVSSAQIVCGSANWNTRHIMGVGENFLTVRDWELRQGSFFTHRDILAAAKVCVIGRTIVEKLFQTSNPIGKTIRIKNIPLQVIGILEAKGANMVGEDQDDIVMTPYTTIRKRLQGSSFANIDFIMVLGRQEEQVLNVEEEIRQLLRERHSARSNEPLDFEVQSMTEIAALLGTITTVMTALLASIAGISLVVGGVGIMNIMLVSVTERTREIGIRLAVGARGRDILRQFLVEAVVLSSLGGGVGVLLGIGAAAGLTAIVNSLGMGLHWPTVISLKAAVIAMLFAGAVGVFFGYYPARRASRLDPIEALRYE